MLYFQIILLFMNIVYILANNPDEMPTALHMRLHC